MGSEGNAREEQADRQFLLCRAAALSDLGEVMRLVRGEDIASMIADEGLQRGRIARSVDTLSGKRAWCEGAAVFVTELVESGVRTVVGSAGLNACMGGFWRGESDALVFEGFPAKERALEFSGTCVSPLHRGRSVGSLHTVARVAFVLMNRGALGERAISYLCASLLPPRRDGVFPFYEDFVKPLLGGRAYREADICRQSDAEIFAPLIAGPARLALASVRAELGEDFATIRAETLGAERALTKHGFRLVGKFDALDAGCFVEASVADLQAHVSLSKLSVRRKKRLHGAEPCFFAPLRPMAEFACVRALGARDGDALLLDAEVFDALGFGAEPSAMFVERR